MQVLEVARSVRLFVCLGMLACAEPRHDVAPEAKGGATGGTALDAAVTAGAGGGGSAGGSAGAAGGGGGSGGAQSSGGAGGSTIDMTPDNGPAVSPPPACAADQRRCDDACIMAIVACHGQCPAGRHLCGDLCASNTSIDSCGPTSCAACVVPTGAVATCDGLACGFSCPPGQHLCDLTCKDNTSPQSCGTSCTPCPGITNGTASCADNKCGTSCNDGFFKCGTSCKSKSPQSSCDNRSITTIAMNNAPTPPDDSRVLCHTNGGYSPVDACPVLKWGNITYWAFSFTDNRLSFDIVGYDGAGRMVKRLEGKGTRYLYQIQFDDKAATFRGENSFPYYHDVVVPWDQLRVDQPPL